MDVSAGLDLGEGVIPHLFVGPDPQKLREGSHKLGRILDRLLVAAQHRGGAALMDQRDVGLHRPKRLKENVLLVVTSLANASPHHP